MRYLSGGEAHNTVEITEHEAHHRITLESRDGPTPFRYRYTLQPRPHGATNIMLDGRISGAGLPGPIGHLGPLATRLFKLGMRSNLAELNASSSPPPDTRSRRPRQPTLTLYRSDAHEPQGCHSNRPEAVREQNGRRRNPGGPGWTATQLLPSPLQPARRPVARADSHWQVANRIGLLQAMR